MTHIIGRGRYARAVYPSRTRGGAGEGDIIAWRPDGTGDARTWSEVATLIAASVVPPIIDVALGQPPYVVTPGTVNLKYGCFQGPLGAPPIFIDVQDGAHFVDLSAVSQAAILDFHPSVGDALSYTALSTPLPGVLLLQRTGGIRNLGSVPLITANPNASGPDFVLTSFEGGIIVAGGTAPIFTAAVGAIVIFEVVSGVNIGPPLPPAFMAGVAGSSVAILHDGTLTFPLPAQPGFAGTLVNVPLGCSPSAGPTSFRPAPFFPLSLGVSYFDTDLVPPRPIWWDGAQWVDATGAPA